MLANDLAFNFDKSANHAEQINCTHACEQNGNGMANVKERKMFRWNELNENVTVSMAHTVTYPGGKVREIAQILS